MLGSVKIGTRLHRPRESCVKSALWYFYVVSSWTSDAPVDIAKVMNREKYLVRWHWYFEQIIRGMSRRKLFHDCCNRILAHIPYSCDVQNRAFYLTGYVKFDFPVLCYHIAILNETTNTPERVGASLWQICQHLYITYTTVITNRNSDSTRHL